MIALIEKNRSAIAEICRRLHVKRLDVFGSASHGPYDPDSSDIDFLVDFDASADLPMAERYFGLQEALETLLERPVDLVTWQSMRNPYFIRSVNETRQQVYAPKSAKLLEDIRDAAAFILSVTEPLDLKAFAEQRVVRQAVEKNFQIIGEAVRRLADEDPETAGKLGPVSRMIPFRNAIVHSYDSLDHSVVWSVVETHVPKLLSAAESLLNRSDDP